MRKGSITGSRLTWRRIRIDPDYPARATDTRRGEFRSQATTMRLSTNRGGKAYSSLTGSCRRAYDPRVDAVPEQEHVAQMQGRLRDIGGLVEAMPPVDDFIAGAELQRQAEMTAHG